MELQILNEEKDVIEIKFIGETHTLCNILRDELWSLEGTSSASYNLKHPLVGHPVLVVKAKKGKARELLFEAVDSLKNKTKELRELASKLN